MRKAEGSYRLKLLIPLIIFGCSSTDHQSGSHHLLDHIQESNDSISYPSFDEDLFDQVEKVQAKLPENELQFFVPVRSKEIESFPCSSCHNKPLDQLRLGKNEKKAHWEIGLDHASSEVMDCATCHKAPASDQLVMLSGQSISFDHSYKLCGQCHSTQIKDWIGGSHGKRLGGWKPPRLTNTCTSCHNPHKPAFETRWPARFNTEKIRQSEK